MDLVIKQHIDRTETVSSSFIDALYQLTKPDSSTGQPAANAILVGRLQTSAAYEDAVNFLNAKFSSEQDNGSDLQITVLNNNYYIRFVDEEVVRVLISQGVMEEGEGLTIAQAAVANVRFRSLFNGNTVVKNFDELRYFDKYKTTGGSGTQQIFDRAKNLESVDLTGIQSTSLYWAFRSCHSLEWYHGKSGPKNVLNLQWRNVSYIEAYAFYENYGLHEVSSLGIVTILQGNCFQKCTNLTTIDISNITTIGTSVFEGDGNLEYFSGSDSTAGELNLPNLTGTLGNSALKGCTKLTSITSLGTITSIGDGAFENCANLATINFPNTITSVGKNAFNNTAWLNNQPDGPVYIAKALYKCKNVSGDFVVPNNIVSISGMAFHDCSNLTSVTIGPDVTSIGTDSGAFKGCTALSAVVVDSNNVIYDSRDNCNAIINTATNTLIAGCKNTAIPNGVTSIGGYAFWACSGLTSVTIPNSVTSIGRFAFSSTGLVSISIPNSVTSIYDTAFSNCSSLTSVTIGNSVTSISDRVFATCYSLTSITIEATVPPTLGVEVFKNTNNCLIYVPAGSVSAYQSASGWSTYASRIQAIPTT